MGLPSSNMELMPSFGPSISLILYMADIGQIDLLLEGRSGQKGHLSKFIQHTNISAYIKIIIAIQINALIEEAAVICIVYTKMKIGWPFTPFSVYTKKLETISTE